MGRSKTARSWRGHSMAGSVCMRSMGCLGAIALCLARLGIAQDSTATPAANPSTAAVIVRARSLIDGTSARPLANPQIVIRGNRIVAVYTAGMHPPPAGAQLIDLGAATVLPGLIDCHTHIFLQGEVPEAGGYNLEGYAPEIVVPKGAQLVDGPVEARKAAREQLDHGADWIKVYMTHRSWVGKKGELVSQPTLTVEELKAIVDEAHGWGKKVACHAYSGIGLQRALDGGCDSIEHGLSLTDAHIAQMIKQGTWYCPTITPYYGDWAPENTPGGQRDRKRASEHEISVQRAAKAGVKTVFGTDMGGIPWTEPMALEFEYMTKSGFTPIGAIQAATSRAGELLDMAGEIGTIAPGEFADSIAVSGDPLRDINELKKVRFVMHDGVTFKNELAAK